TSGTSSGVRKHIPVSRAMLSSNASAIFDLFVHHIAHRPQSRLFGGKNFMLGSSAVLSEAAPGIYHGDLSGIALNKVPRWVSPFAFPPRRLELDPVCVMHADLLARLLLGVDQRISSGTTSSS